MVSIASVTYKDTGLRLVVEKLRELRMFTLTLGFQGPSGMQLYATGINVASVALFNEFGTGKMAARAFLRSAIFEGRKVIERLWAIGLERLMTRDSYTVKELFTSIGSSVVELIERKIASAANWAKPNKPSTIAAKGHDLPLHDTELMSESVTWAIRDRSGNIVKQGNSHGK
jgi:hypothetical protein